MAKVDKYSMEKKKLGSVELPDSIFSAKINEGLIHQAVCIYLANARQGNASTKTRAEVRGGGKRPYRQKGTGMARHGSIRSPIFVGGGATFGPRPRSWTMVMPKKQKKQALKSALALKNSTGNLFVVDKWLSDSGKTKEMAKIFKNWEMKSGLVVTDKTDAKTLRSVRNVPNVKITEGKNLNVYDLVRYDHLIMTEAAVNSLSERFV